MFFSLTGGSCVGLCQIASDGSGITLVDSAIGDGANYGIRRLSNNRVAYVAHNSPNFALKVATAGQPPQTWFSTTGISSVNDCTWQSTDRSVRVRSQKRLAI